MLTPEREKEIRFHAEQFHHNSSAIDDCDAERSILELLEEIDRLRNERYELKTENERLRVEIEFTKNVCAETLARFQKIITQDHLDAEEKGEILKKVFCSVCHKKAQKTENGWRCIGCNWEYYP